MQKRPTIYAKETYYRCKRDLLYMQKRPTIYAKEKEKETVTWPTRAHVHIQI